MRLRSRIRGCVRSERGQVLPLVVVAAVVLIGFTGFAIDMGRVWVAKQQLQRAVDAATLAAGQDLPDASSALAAAQTYSANGSANPVTGWGVTAGAPSVTFECVKSGPDYNTGSGACLTDSSGDNCHPSGSNAVQPSGATTCNAVYIKESATVKTGLLSLFIPSFTVTASSTATARQAGSPNPLDIYVILDTTKSMSAGSSDNGITASNNSAYCSATVSGISAPYAPDKLDCAKAGVRTLLQTLNPAEDSVGLLVFPALTEVLSGSSPNFTLPASGPPSTSLNDELDCNSSDSFSVTYPYWSDSFSSGIPSSYISAYHQPGGDEYLGYEAVPLASNYQSSAGVLNGSSSVVKAVWWSQCSGGNFPGGDYYGIKDIGGQGSYLAGAITEGQYLLSQAPSTNAAGQTVTKAMIILTDGEFNDPDSGKDGVDPQSSNNVGWTDTTPCGDAEEAAAQAKAAGDVIFSIAYDDTGGSCDDSGKNANGYGYSGTASGLVQALASSSSDYSDQSGAAGDLTTAFSAAASQLTGNSQLMPDCTTAPNC